MSQCAGTFGGMVLDGRWVRYGPDASEALAEAIGAAKGGEPLAPVTVVVPSNQVGVSARRELASGRLGPVCGGGGHGLIGVNFLTPYRLAELLGSSALAATGRRPVSTPVLTAAVRAVLTSEPGMFAAVATHPATESTLVSAYRELRDLAPPRLRDLAATGERASEVVRITGQARRALEPHWYDEEDLMTAATEALSGGDPLGLDLGSVIIHLPERLTRHAGTFLAEVGRTARSTLLAGTTGVARADAEVVAAVARLGAAEQLGAPPSQPILPEVVDPARTRIITASDADDEVRAVVRAVVDAVRDGTPLDRIAVLHASAQPYARLLREQFTAAGIVVNGTADIDLTGRVAGRALLGLLELPLGGFRRSDVLSWLSGAPILVDGRPLPISAWERLSRRAGVVGGVDEWDRLLARLADELDDRATELEGDDTVAPWRIERDRSDAARARSLRAFVLWAAGQIAAEAAEPKPWSSRVTWAKRLLTSLLGGPGRRGRWPDVERRAAERVELALDRLASLDAVEGPVDLDVFTRTLLGEMEADLGRIGRFGEGVLVGPVSMGIGLHLDLVILVGMVEGTFPSTTRDDSLLPDDDRQATGGELPLRREHLDRLHHRFLAAIGGAGRQVLTVPRGDLRRSNERVPSRWALDVASELAGERWWGDDLYGAATADHPWITQLASYDASLRTLRQPATEQEHRLRTLLAADPTRRRLLELAEDLDPTFASGVTVLDARQSDALTRFDGNLAGLAVPGLAVDPAEAGRADHGAVTSTTRLERWAKCPFSYFMADVLGVQEVEDPEANLRITALERGSLIHDVLERFVLEVLGMPEAERPGFDDRWTEAHRESLRRIAGEVCDEYESRGVTGRPIFWRRERRQILADVDRFITEDDHRRAKHGGAVPLAAELAFGLPRGGPAVELPLPDGRIVRIRGKADRIDRTADGALLVVDYKTGGARKYAQLSDADPHLNGRCLQLVVYGQAARAHVGDSEILVRADYWFTSTKGKFEQKGYEVTPEVFDVVTEAIHTIVTGIEAGLFPPHPEESGKSWTQWIDCPHCDPDGLGTGDARRAWERKVGDPVQEPYLLLAGVLEPEDEPEPEPEPILGGPA